MKLDPTYPRATPAGEELEPTHPRTPPVDRIIGGRYRLEVLLAAGGMGEVYRATHVELGRPLALKLMRPELSKDPEFVERFRREAMTASRLGHPHIVDIIDSGSDEGQFYFVMEFLDGKTLSSLVAEGPVALPLALDLVTQIAEALDVAHRAGVVHRDLKPDNVIVLQRGGRPFVKLVDFGIAKVVTPPPDQKQTTHGVIMGTPQYMAPEQAAGVALDARADVYALGLILYELVTGQPPLRGETAALVMSAHISQTAPALPPRVPSSLRSLVAKMLAKRPEDRPQTMAEVMAGLAASPRVEARRRPWGALALVVGCITVGAGGVLLLVRPTPTPPPVTPAPIVAPSPAPPAPSLNVAPEPAAPAPVAARDPEVPDAGVPASPKRPPRKPSPKAPVPELLPAEGL